MRVRTSAILAVAILSQAIGGPQDPAGLEITFIGNMAFRISDGQTTLLTDFPYSSGAFGYMRYDLAAAGDLANGVALISHGHADHWDPELFARLDLRLIAAPAISAEIDPERVVPWSERIEIGNLVVTPIPTDHSPAHHSYRVRWNALELYFTGDTESTVELTAQRDLDVAFISPWLGASLARDGLRVDAERVVIYHHLPGDAPALAGAMQPAQGDTFRLPFREPAVDPACAAPLCRARDRE